MSVNKVHARQILDSRGKPTIEVEVTTQDGIFRAAVPSGASTGAHEACELRDGDKSIHQGQGVLKAVENVKNILGPALIASKISVTDQSAVDKLLIDTDGTSNKTKYGANAILGVSLAVARAGAAHKKVPLYQHIANLANVKTLSLPTPSFNVINGGSHAGNSLAIQEFMVMPIGASKFSEALQIGCEIYQTLKKEIKTKYGQDAVNVGDEGGFAPNISDTRECLELLMQAIKSSGHESKVKIALDVAASEFYDKKTGIYDLGWKTSNSSKLSGEELASFYGEILAKYPIISIEDPFDEDDWKSWKDFKAKNQVQIVADDLTVTNPNRIKRAIEEQSANALLLKVNQIGTLTESIQAANLAKSAGWKVMVSHRSGETEDTFIADLAVGLGAAQIKSGAPCRSERVAKYNQLLRIEEEIQNK